MQDTFLLCIYIQSIINVVSAYTHALHAKHTQTQLHLTIKNQSRGPVPLCVAHFILKISNIFYFFKKVFLLKY